MGNVGNVDFNIALVLFSDWDSEIFRSWEITSVEIEKRRGASCHRNATRRHSGKLCIIPSHIYTSARAGWAIGWEVRENAVAYRLEIAPKSLPGVQHPRTREVPGLTNGCSRWNCSSPEPASRERKFSTVVARLHPPEILGAACSPCRFIIAAFVFVVRSKSVRNLRERTRERSVYSCDNTVSKDIFRRYDYQTYGKILITLQVNQFFFNFLYPSSVRESFIFKKIVFM